MYEQTKRQHSLMNIRLQPLVKKQDSHLEPQISRKNTDQTKRFRQNNHNQRRRLLTDHTADNFYLKFQNKRGKSNNHFEEEYLRLVQKLKVNLSNQCFQRKRSKDFVKQKPYFYGDEPHSSSNRYFSLQKKRNLQQYDRLQEYSKEMMTNLRGVKNKSKSKSIHRQISAREQNIQIGSKDSNQNMLSLENKVNKMEDYSDGGNNREEILINRKENNNTQVTKRKYHKLNALKEERKKILKNIPEIQHRSQSKDNFNHTKSAINLAYPKIDELCFHFQILFNIYQSCCQQQMAEGQLLNKVKYYVLGNKKVVDTSHQMLTDDIAHLQHVFIDQLIQKDLRNIICMQRVLMILAIDLIATSIFKKYLPEIKQILQSLLGLYFFMLYQLKQGRKFLPQYSESCLLDLQAQIRQHNIHFKKQLSSLCIFIDKKLFPLMKNNQTLLGQIKILLLQFEERNVSINRSFYELLKMYAIYLNYNDHIIQRNYPAIKTFATCPSPYLTKPTNKTYTLVLDLDETLIYARDQTNKLDIFLRPFAKQFLSTMSSSFQIVIFTSSMPVHSESIIAQLPGISHTLYRYHTTRVKNRFIKDISRLGRPIQTIVIVDNDEQSFGMHGGNGIRIREWRGEDKNDQQLNVIGLFLQNMVDSKQEDVRQYLDGYSEFRKKYI